MNPHDGLVSKQMLRDLRHLWWPSGANSLVRQLAAVEPDIAETLPIMINNAMKLLDPFAIPDEFRQCTVDLILATAITAILAVRQTHRELWNATAEATLLNQLDPDRGGEHS